MRSASFDIVGNQISRIAYTRDAGKIDFIFRVFLRVVSLLPITTLFQGYSAFSWVNKLLIAISVVLLFFSFFYLKMRMEIWFQLLSVIGLTAIGMCFTQEALINSNMPVYFPFFVLLLTLASEQADLLRVRLRENVRWYRNICIIWCLLVVLSIPLSVSYDKDGYFTSFTGNSFRTDPAALLILTYLILLVRNDACHRSLSFVLSLVPLYCGLMGSSRTYFLVILLTYFIFLRCLIRDNRAFIFSLIMAFAVIVPVIFASNIGQRMVNSLSDASDGYYGFWATLTSGRSRFWAHDIQRFFELPFLNQLIGAGFNRVFFFNRELGTFIWAHNDFLNIVITNGYVGLISYLVAVYSLFKMYKKNRSTYKTSFFILMILIWAFNAFFNMVYTYTCATIALAILPLVLGDCESANA